ncbi:hypothetical protein MNBD_ALPHA12-741 [hydrothermal vent metagenome]|uniref:N-acetyltransferase domain-containing protein n=1 Tax=hydrothermal vent metagenome TaxID=652676 RepID=A0A3B0U0A9_9ZZZZ
MRDLSGVILRPFKKTDIAPITAIYAHYVKTSAVTFDIEVPDVDQMAKKFAALEKAGHPLIIAQYQEDVAGFAYASSYRPRRAYRFTCEDAIYLDPKMLGRGIGSLLLGELVEKSRRFGFNQMIAIITDGTDNSIGLHKKHGFEILGRFPELGYKFNRWHDTVHMQKKL